MADRTISKTMDGGVAGRGGLISRRGVAIIRCSGLALGAGGLVFTCASCTASLADGYRPRPLDASSSQRRAYYATPFTPEAENATPEQPSGPSEHRPGAY